MRRKDKAVEALISIEAIIRKSLVCRLALSDNNRPYIIPLCFGYTDHTLYFHSAPEGKKLEILRNNNNVCFEFDVDHRVVQGDTACKWSMKYRSVVGFGKASLVEDPEEKKRGLDAIMAHYSGRSFDYLPEAVGKTTVIKVEIEAMTGKQSGY